MINYNNPIKRVFNYTLEQIEAKEQRVLNAAFKLTLKKIKKEVKNKTVYFDSFGNLVY